MAVIPTLILIDDYQPVFDWLDAHVPKKQIVRTGEADASAGGG